MWNKFKHRSTQAEWMDEPDVSRELLYKNLRELDVLNRYFGGYCTSLKGIKQLISAKKNTYHIVDLGCGSGDFLRYLARWARKKHISVKLTGIEKNKNAIRYLQHHCMDYPEISGIEADYRDYIKSGEKPDIYHCSLFCHHLNDTEVSDLFGTMKNHARKGFVVNDLIRSPFAYFSTVAFTNLANATPLAKNDGPISVLRGFTINEIKQMVDHEGITYFKLQRGFGFRFLLVACNHHKMSNA